MAAASVGVANPNRIEPMIKTGRIAARMLSLRATPTLLMLNFSSVSGKFQRFPLIAISAIQTAQISNPGRIPAANKPAMDTPMIEP